MLAGQYLRRRRELKDDENEVEASGLANGPSLEDQASSSCCSSSARAERDSGDEGMAVGRALVTAAAGRGDPMGGGCCRSCAIEGALRRTSKNSREFHGGNEGQRQRGRRYK